MKIAILFVLAIFLLGCTQGEHYPPDPDGPDGPTTIEVSYLLENAEAYVGSTVRVIGNESVHPGTIDLRDNRDIAVKLFELVNIIAQVMITNPKDIEGLFDSLPEEKKDAISRRDSTT